MDAFLASTLAVAIAEIGDKTQLLSLVLVARYGKRTPIIFGILVATVVNHALSAWLGSWVANRLPEVWLGWILVASFIIMALWLLVPDKDTFEQSPWMGLGAFAATTVLFFLAEIGDKTQVATVLLAARYTDVVWVIIGTTIGMLLANVPVIMAGRWLMERLPLTMIRMTASFLFFALAIMTIRTVLMNS
ncbi:hypothetical protein C7H09_02300 [Marinobacter fuscus]|uniref:GDT1 family protein n=1 Tax=Marinobacter fuscus TaxID=2109942 RepID=A0A2T1KTM1_9GAMM|nr:TMEM165/GDT1 family protein [Marinobacter fuscus]PSF13456.1 hypothetical protein C7H09_02300 [Marinobacter fuscus]